MANAQIAGSPPLEPSSAPSPAGPCPGCGERVDPLRAGHVAILEGRFRYFCRSDCKQSYLRAHGRPAEEDVPTAAPPSVADAPAVKAEEGSAPSHPRPRTTSSPSNPSWAPPAAPLPQNDVSLRPTLPSPAPPSGVYANEQLGLTSPSLPGAVTTTRRGAEGLAALDAAGIVFGLLATALGLLGPMADVARIPLVVASWAALTLRLVVMPRDGADPHPLVVLAPTGGAVAAACWASAVHDSRTAAIVALAGLSCAAATGVERLVGRARVRLTAARDRIELALDVLVRTVAGGPGGVETVALGASEVRAGEPILVEAGELVGVDAVVAAGEARVVPWLDAREEVTLREGDSVVAGARVLSSRLRMTTTWSGRDRAWLKLLSSPDTRIDVVAPTVRALRHVVERGAPVAAVLVGVAGFAASATPVQILAGMCAGATAFAAKAASCAAGVHFGRAHLEALARGITYKDSRAFERAASTNLAVLSARGTVLMGEPEIVVIEALGPIEVERVLSLAAGAETVSTHPFAAAVLRAARTRGVRADHARNATVRSGLGVTAVASTGERLVVGGRAIMLEEKVGVAMTDARVSELEAQGRSVLLVALGDRLVGLIALQDGLRPGARAAVQKLLDAGIEPVLLSGEARDTCDTIGRALDIEHVRPEVLPAERGAEVRALAEGGNVVAVIGHPTGDDGALGAADVAVAMGAAGSTPGEWAVSLAGDDVRDAASALAIPRAARDRARVAIALGGGPGVVALLAIGFGVAPLALAPIAALIGAIAVFIHAREHPAPS